MQQEYYEHLVLRSKGAVFDECSIEGKTFFSLVHPIFHACKKRRDTFFVAVETVTKG